MMAMHPHRAGLHSTSSAHSAVNRSSSHSPSLSPLSSSPQQNSLDNMTSNNASSSNQNYHSQHNNNSSSSSSPSNTNTSSSFAFSPFAPSYWPNSTPPAPAMNNRPSSQPAQQSQYYNNPQSNSPSFLSRDSSPPPPSLYQSSTAFIRQSSDTSNIQNHSHHPTYFPSTNRQYNYSDNNYPNSSFYKEALDPPAPVAHTQSDPSIPSYQPNARGSKSQLSGVGPSPSHAAGNYHNNNQTRQEYANNDNGGRSGPRSISVNNAYNVNSGNNYNSTHHPSQIQNHNYSAVSSRGSPTASSIISPRAVQNEYNPSSTSSSAAPSASAGSFKISATTNVSPALSATSHSSNSPTTNASNSPVLPSPLLASTPTNSEAGRSGGTDEYGSTLYKTELCRSFSETGYCRYGVKCRFAHGLNDLRTVNRHKKYKTEQCKNFTRDGHCPYGPRCRFVHNPFTQDTDELPGLGPLTGPLPPGLQQEVVNAATSTTGTSSPYFSALVAAANANSTGTGTNRSPPILSPQSRQSPHQISLPPPHSTSSANVNSQPSSTVLSSFKLNDAGRQSSSTSSTTPSLRSTAFPSPVHAAHSTGGQVDETSAYRLRSASTSSATSSSTLVGAHSGPGTLSTSSTPYTSYSSGSSSSSGGYTPSFSPASFVGLPPSSSGSRNAAGEVPELRGLSPANRPRGNGNVPSNNSNHYTNVDYSNSTYEKPTDNRRYNEYNSNIYNSNNPGINKNNARELNRVSNENINSDLLRSASSSSPIAYPNGNVPGFDGTEELSSAEDALDLAKLNSMINHMDLRDDDDDEEEERGYSRSLASGTLNARDEIRERTNREAEQTYYYPSQQPTDLQEQEFVPPIYGYNTNQNQRTQQQQPSVYSSSQIVAHPVTALDTLHHTRAHQHENSPDVYSTDAYDYRMNQQQIPLENNGRDDSDALYPHSSYAYLREQQSPPATVLSPSPSLSEDSLPSLPLFQSQNRPAPNTSPPSQPFLSTNFPPSSAWSANTLTAPASAGPASSTASNLSARASSFSSSTSPFFHPNSPFAAPFQVPQPTPLDLRTNSPISPAQSSASSANSLLQRRHRGSEDLLANAKANTEQEQIVVEHEQLHSTNNE